MSGSLVPPISIKTVLTCLLWYTVSSITSQLTKLILTKFTYPLFLSQCQFLIGAALAAFVIVVAKSFPHVEEYFPAGSIPSSKSRTQPVLSFAMLLKAFPLGLFQFVGKYFSLSATSLIPLPTISSVKALSPLLIVLGYRIIYHVVFPPVTYLSLAPLLIGVILIITSDSVKNPHSTTNLLTNENHEIDNKQVQGLVLCLLSTVVFAAQNIYGKQIITWDNADKSHNPASLVLNTEPSKPSTPLPSFEFEKNNHHPKSQFGYFEPKSANNNGDFAQNNAKKYLHVRQRSNSVHLPYSTSDLTLDQRKENHLWTPPTSPHSLNTYSAPTYAHTARVGNTNAYNPFAYFINRFQLDKVPKPDKMTIILYCSLIGSSFSIGGFLMNELPKMYRQFAFDSDLENIVDTTSDFLAIMVLILLDSLSHFLQTLLAFHLLGSIPALSYSIASMMKRIVLITVSIIITLNHATVVDGAQSIQLGQLTTEQIVGLVLIAIGLYCYDRWGSRSLKSK
ncbi:uncharacterized protein LODBEIA_P06860 [Lodderomyces beijingensis]|uniref:Sugar phosphate transporter domain-containing protein n=1 Tax=Lodderomyces beijingensis TaxID=1775926 RepID=A0ABP0ZE92_9ASCO